MNLTLAIDEKLPSAPQRRSGLKANMASRRASGSRAAAAAAAAASKKRQRAGRTQAVCAARSSSSSPLSTGVDGSPAAPTHSSVAGAAVPKAPQQPQPSSEVAISTWLSRNGDVACDASECLLPTTTRSIAASLEQPMMTGAWLDDDDVVGPPLDCDALGEYDMAAAAPLT